MVTNIKLTDCEIIDNALRFDMKNILERYKKDSELSDEAVEAHEIELKRFLALCAISPKKYGMAGIIDDLWHTFIIFTKDYHRFCESLGQTYMHHQPTLKTEDEKEIEEIKSRYTFFLEDYKSTFKVEPPRHIWPDPSIITTQSPSCNRCGNYCARTCVA